jgi:hypothetical protein
MTIHIENPIDSEIILIELINSATLQDTKSTQNQLHFCKSIMTF